MLRIVSIESLIRLVVSVCCWQMYLCHVELTVQSNSQTEEMDCGNVTEIDIYNFFEQHAPPSHWIRPVKSQNKPVPVNMELAIRSILGLNVLNQELFLTGSVFISWTDEFRIWNTTFPLNCVDTVTLEFGVNTKIWIPDICFFNS